MQPLEERVFAALADTTRRQLLATLAENSPRTATQLAQSFPITRQGILKHLAILAEAELVQARPAGRERRFSFKPAPLRSASQWLDAIGVKWESRLLALKELVEGDEEL